MLDRFDVFFRRLTVQRWLIPLGMAVVGFGYVVWENILVDRHPIFSPPALFGFLILSVIGPLLTYVSLSWGHRVAKLFQRAEQRREKEHQQILALNKLGEVVNQSLELDTVLNRAIDQVLELMHLDSGEVRLIEEGQLVLRTARNVSPRFIDAERTIPLGQCMCGKSAQTGQLIAIEDMGQSEMLADSACACDKFQSVLSVPVRNTDSVVGVIHIASREPRKFDAGERDLLMAVGQQIGVAIEKTRLHAQLKLLNQELEQRVLTRTQELIHAKEELSYKADALTQVLVEERRVEEKTRAKIAHDLHDSVQQLIIGALFETQAARDTLTSQPDTAAQRLTSTQALLRRIEAEMRRAIYSLRPVALDEHGLVPALREYSDEFAKLANVECYLSSEGAFRRFNPDAEVAAFRIAQEALNNVKAHASAQHVQIHLVWGVRDLHMTITDDGKGFALSQVTRQSRTRLGLIGMQERAEAVGGKLDLTSRPGEGTRVSVRVPVN